MHFLYMIFQGKTYLPYIAAAILLFLVIFIRRETFAHLSRWLEEARQNGNDNMTIMLIGNKCDLEHRRQVSPEEGKKFADENRLMFLETSAKTAHNVEQAFLKPAQQIYSKIQRGIYDVSNEQYGIKVGMASQPSVNNSNNNNVKNNSGGCCQLL